MYARALIIAATLAAAGPVGADEPAGSSDSQTPEKQPTQEIGARLGLEAGGRVTPGGLHVEGAYLYRFTDIDWLEQVVGFTFGGQSAECFRDRSDEVVCDHGILNGFSAELGLAVRRYFPGQGVFSPFARAGLAVRGVFYSADDLRGIAVPIWLGGGVRATVTKGISVTADASLKTGFGILNRGLGLEPNASFAITAGAEFVLD